MKSWDAQDSNLVLPVKSRLHRRVCLHPTDEEGEREGSASRTLAASAPKMRTWWVARGSIPVPSLKRRVHQPECLRPGCLTSEEAVCLSTLAASRIACDGHARWSSTTCQQDCGLPRQRDCRWLRRDLAVPRGIEPRFAARQADVLAVRRWNQKK